MEKNYQEKYLKLLRNYIPYTSKFYWLLLIVSLLIISFRLLTYFKKKLKYDVNVIFLKGPSFDV